MEHRLPTKHSEVIVCELLLPVWPCHWYPEKSKINSSTRVKNLRELRTYHFYTKVCAIVEYFSSILYKSLLPCEIEFCSPIFFFVSFLSISKFIEEEPKVQKIKGMRLGQNHPLIEVQKQKRSQRKTITTWNSKTRAQK